MDRARRGVPLLDDVLVVEHSDLSPGHFRLALEFASGAEIANANAPALMPNFVGANAAHSTELALRAFLLSKLQPRAVKRIGSRHNLERMWTEAAKRGLPIDANVPRWCKMLNAAHGIHIFFGTQKARPASLFPVKHCRN